MAAAAVAHDDYVLHFLRNGAFMSARDCAEGRWPSDMRGAPAMTDSKPFMRDPTDSTLGATSWNAWDQCLLWGDRAAHELDLGNLAPAILPLS